MQGKAKSTRPPTPTPAADPSQIGQGYDAGFRGFDLPFNLHDFVGLTLDKAMEQDKHTQLLIGLLARASTFTSPLRTLDQELADLNEQFTLGHSQLPDHLHQSASGGIRVHTRSTHSHEINDVHPEHLGQLNELRDRGGCLSRPHPADPPLIDVAEITELALRKARGLTDALQLVRKGAIKFA